MMLIEYFSAPSYNQRDTEQRRCFIDAAAQVEICRVQGNRHPNPLPLSNLEEHLRNTHTQTQLGILAFIGQVPEAAPIRPPQAQRCPPHAPQPPARRKWRPPPPPLTPTAPSLTATPQPAPPQLALQPRPLAAPPPITTEPCLPPCCAAPQDWLRAAPAPPLSAESPALPAAPCAGSPRLSAHEAAPPSHWPFARLLPAPAER